MLDATQQVKGIVLSAVGAIILSGVPASSVSQDDSLSKPRVSDDPLTSEQMAVYRGAVSAWFGKQEKGAMNLAILTAPIEEDEFGYDRKCVGRLGLEPVGTKEVHRFRTADLPQFRAVRLHLVDSDEQRKEIDQNDPGKAIRNGEDVDEAVSNGFHHALFTLGEIRFDKKHTVAVVSFSFVCGNLCGNGSTMVMKKQPNGEWKRIRSCGGWVS